MAKKDAKWQAKQEAKAEKHAAKAERQKHRRKAQAVLTLGQIADQLRALATQVETGTVVLGDKELALPGQAEIEINCQLERITEYYDNLSG